jgi:hypothetical protein
MNERIKEIILEHGLGKLGCTSRMEMLAELIVKECASLAEDGFFDDLDGQEISDGIKNHFGV